MDERARPRGGEAAAQGGRSAAQRAVAFLRERTGMDSWAISRLDGEEAVILEVEPPPGDAALQVGDRLPWSDTLVSRMIAGAPRAVVDIEREPVYADAPILERVSVRAYIGAPVHRPDGEMYGGLSGWSARVGRPGLADHLPLVDAFADLLGGVLEAEERAERAEVDASVDAVTGAASRRAWERTLDVEERRCRRYDHQASVLLADLDHLKEVNDREGHAAGDKLLRAAARAIVSAARTGDVVARLGGDEFGILAIESDERAASALASRVRVALDRAGVRAAVGLASRPIEGTLWETWEAADRAMYVSKAERAGGRGGA